MYQEEINCYMASIKKTQFQKENKKKTIYNFFKTYTAYFFMKPLMFWIIINFLKY